MNTPIFDTSLMPPLSDTEKKRRDALMMLDNISDYGGSPELMMNELKFNFGYTDAQAKSMYREWLRVR